ncbi:MAG: hypothetical protein KatS3mg023_3870 [Armatimonadota bacterium]|nr:MAG: hypothetical protein KatS3mg023_3870 [Armatimonadota bacterium]
MSSGSMIIDVRPDVLQTAIRKRKLKLYFPEDNKLEVGDIVLVTTGAEAVRMEVVSTKLTRFAFLEESDLEPSIRDFGSRRNILATMRRLVNSDITPMDIVKVVGLEAWTYDLKSLNSMIDKHDTGN